MILMKFSVVMALSHPYTVRLLTALHSVLCTLLHRSHAGAIIIVLRIDLRGFMSVNNEKAAVEPGSEPMEINLKPLPRGLWSLVSHDFLIKILYSYGAAVFLGALYFTARANPEIFKLESATLSVITQFYNALTLLLVPFILGIIGAISRIMMAGIKASNHVAVIFSSGLMASFSWLSLKSKVFLSLVTPYVAHVQSPHVEVGQASAIGDEFYSMALVAVLVGMFASNIYIAINQKVESMTSKK